MKYWGYLFAKLLVGAGVVYALQTALIYTYPVPPPPLPKYGPPPPLFLHDFLFTFAIFGIWLIGAGLFSAILYDQRRRCRACLHRLIMPVRSGSWGHLVTFGRPTTELICPFGHGTLSIEELQITGRQTPDWQPHNDNIWKELESYYQAQK
ncbi:MAG: hypothetical protein WB992_12375 [Bryobacteraceae bacterium]